MYRVANFLKEQDHQKYYPKDDFYRLLNYFLQDFLNVGRTPCADAQALRKDKPFAQCKFFVWLYLSKRWLLDLGALHQNHTVYRKISFYPLTGCENTAL